MRRLAAFLSATLALAALPLAARAQSAAAPPDPRAETLNEQGKALYLESQDFAGAVAKFRAAIAIRPDARYSYNLCTALEKTGDLSAALAACNDVAAQSPRPDLADKASRRAAEIRRLLPPSPNLPPGPGMSAPPGPPPSPDLYPTPPDNSYGWSLGGDLGIVHNANIGTKDLFGPNGGAIRLRAEIVVAPKLHLGIEPWLDLQNITRPGAQTFDRALSMVNLGVAITWHARLFDSLYFVPAAGLAFASLGVGQPAPDPNDVYSTIGIRADAGLEWVFSGGQHVVSLVPFAFTFYPAPIGQIAGRQFDPAGYGLDKGGVTWSFLLGYRFRFRGSVINLE